MVTGDIEQNKAGKDDKRHCIQFQSVCKTFPPPKKKSSLEQKFAGNKESNHVRHGKKKIIIY